MFDIKLTTDEKDIVNAVYKYFKANSEWPSVRQIKNEIGINKVNEVLKNQTYLIPHALLVVRDNNNLKLTFFGFLVCPTAQEDIEIVLSYINLLKKDYGDSDIGEADKITSYEIEKALNLSKEQLKRLSLIMRIGWCYLNGGGVYGEEWNIWVPDENIMDKIIKGSAAEYLNNIIREIQESEDNYKKSLEQNRYGSIPFTWISMLLNLFFFAWILLLYHPFILFNEKIALSKIFLHFIDILWLYAFLFVLIKIIEIFRQKESKILSSRKIIEHWVIDLISFGFLNLVAFFVIR